MLLIWEDRGGMSEIVEVDLGNGNTILAEITIAGGDVGALDRLKLAGTKSVIASVGRWAKESIQAGLPGAPQRFGVEFGIKLAMKSGELASVLAQVAGEATLTVKMEWEPGNEGPGSHATNELPGGQWTRKSSG
jgi:hypothetical protein